MSYVILVCNIALIDLIRSSFNAFALNRSSCKHSILRYSHKYSAPILFFLYSAFITKLFFLINASDLKKLPLLLNLMFESLAVVSSDSLTENITHCSCLEVYGRIRWEFFLESVNNQHVCVCFLVPAAHFVLLE